MPLSLSTDPLLQVAAAEPDEVGPSAEEDQADEDQNLQEASPDSPRGPAVRGWRPNAARVPNRSSLKGGNSTIRRKPQMDPITESRAASSDQQDSLANEEDLLQVLLSMSQCLARCTCLAGKPSKQVGYRNSCHRWKASFLTPFLDLLSYDLSEDHCKPVTPLANVTMLPTGQPFFIVILHSMLLPCNQ